MVNDEDDADGMARAMAIFRANVVEPVEDRPVPRSRAIGSRSRRALAERIKTTVDGRSLRATGRTKQFNFQCRPEIHRLAVDLANDAGMTVAEFMESLIEQARGER